MYSSLNQVDRLAEVSCDLNFDSLQTIQFLKQSHYLGEISHHQHKSLYQNLFQKVYREIVTSDSQ